MYNYEDITTVHLEVTQKCVVLVVQCVIEMKMVVL